MTNWTIKRRGPHGREKLLELLKSFIREQGSPYISGREFERWSGVSEATVARHFGSWADFCREAGCYPRYTRTSDKHLLLENLGKVWRKLGRQPRAKEMKQPLSPISYSRYLREFGNWHTACVCVVERMGPGVSEMTTNQLVRHNVKRHARRSLSLALRYAVLSRDQFRCAKCGRSPAMERGVMLHIDHVIALANGGETALGNLQTLCEDCNLGKACRA
jgi:hypothetical protein